MARPPLLPEPWLALAISVNKGEVDGCVQALASSLGGVDTRLVRKWAHGQVPSTAARPAIRAVFKKHQIESPV